MKKSILTDRQREILESLGASKFISDKFYMSGGTALSEFYTHHRLSEDLDFFCFEEFIFQDFFVEFKKITSKLFKLKYSIENSFNRNLIYLEFNDGEIIKTEFTYYPFKQLEEGIIYKNIQVDSLLDIAVNKVFTIYQNPRTRDFIDLFIIKNIFKLELAGLIKKARLKFDWHIDNLQLASRFLEASTIKDYPNLLTEINDEEWINYFKDESIKLSDTIIST